MKLPRYPKYKDSGVKWLGKVPEHWEVKRLRFVARLNPSKSEIKKTPHDTLVSFLPMEAIGDDGQLDLSRTKPLEEVSSGYTYFAEGDVTLAKITPCFENGKGALMKGLTAGIGFGTTELIVARPIINAIESEYLACVFNSQTFRKLGESEMYGAGGQKRVPDDFVRNFYCGIPPQDERTRILQFIETEIGKINALIEEQRRLIDLLKEKRQAIISHAVTKGLNADAPMKPSGIDWIGDIPAHWDVERTKWLFTERDQRSSTGDEEMLTVSHLTGVTPRSEKNVTMFEAETNEGYKLCHAGDLVINTLWAWMGAMGIAPIFGMVSPAYNVYTPGKQLWPAYVDSLVRMPLFAQEITRYSKGVWTSRLRLYPEGLYQAYFPVPPLDEQKAIAEHIVNESTRIESLMLAANKSIELLQEHRLTLISNAVTGQIDVRGESNAVQ